MKNKTRKLLGRFAAALIILALVLSVFSCAKVPTEDGAVVDSLKTENNIPPENNTEKTGEKTDSPTENAETQDPMAFTVNDKFSAYEVAVVLTDEETAKNKQYTIADFEDYDIFYVAHFSCYLEECYPEYKGKRGLVLYLNEPSKERVLEYCEKLSKDPRIEVAEPNIYSMYQDKIYVELTDEAKADYINVSVDWFPEVDITEVFKLTERDFNDKNVVLFLDKEDEHNMYQQIKRLIDNKYVKTARPVYYETTDNCIQMYLNIDVNPKEFIIEVIKEDYPEIQINSVYSPHNLSIPRDDGTEFYSYRMRLEKSTKKIYKIAEKIEKHPLIDEANAHSIGGIAYIFESIFDGIDIIFDDTYEQ